jgi:hypothetical protein
MAGADLTAQQVRELFDYNSETGVLTRRTRVKGSNGLGKQAGWTDDEGYWRVCVNGRNYLVHRLAWLYVYGAMPPKLVDHINGDPSDNRISNLRLADHALNNQNNRRAKSTKKSGTLIGVKWSQNRWVARISVDGKQQHIGRFQTEQEAHAAYVEAKRRLHPGTTL